MAQISCPRPAHRCVMRSSPSFGHSAQGFGLEVAKQGYQSVDPLCFPDIRVSQYTSGRTGQSIWGALG